MDTDKFADGPVALPGDPHRLGLVDKRDVVAFLGAGEQVAVGALVDGLAWPWRRGGHRGTQRHPAANFTAQD
jgi:hypothetical protein